MNLSHRCIVDSRKVSISRPEFSPLQLTLDYKIPLDRLLISKQTAGRESTSHVWRESSRLCKSPAIGWISHPRMRFDSHIYLYIFCLLCIFPPIIIFDLIDVFSSFVIDSRWISGTLTFIVLVTYCYLFFYILPLCPIFLLFSFSFSLSFYYYYNWYFYVIIILPIHYLFILLLDLQFYICHLFFFD